MKMVLIGNMRSYVTKRLKQEAEERGHTFDSFSIKETRFSVEDTVQFKTKGGVDLLAYDAYIFRGMGGHTPGLYPIARFLHKNRKVVVEKSFAERGMHGGKLMPTLLQHKVPVVPYTFLLEPDEKVYEQFGFPLVVKSRGSSCGKKVHLAQNVADVEKSAEEFKWPLIIQKYIPLTCDYRVTVVNGIARSALKRCHDGTGFLTNADDSTFEKTELPKKALAIAERAAKAAEFTLAGVDLVDDNGIFRCLEVNMSPNFKGYEKATGENIAGPIVEYIEKEYRKTKKGLFNWWR